MTLRIPAKVLLHVWSYDFYDMTLSTGKQRRHMINNIFSLRMRTPTIWDFDQDPVVQSIISLTISLRHKFVKQISAKVTNTLLFFVEKNVRILCSAKDSHIFSTKNNSVFVILN